MDSQAAVRVAVRQEMVQQGDATNPFGGDDLQRSAEKQGTIMEGPLSIPKEERDAKNTQRDDATSRLS